MPAMEATNMESIQLIAVVLLSLPRAQGMAKEMTIEEAKLQGKEDITSCTTDSDRIATINRTASGRNNVIAVTATKTV